MDDAQTIHYNKALMLWYDKAVKLEVGPLKATIPTRSCSYTTYNNVEGNQNYRELHKWQELEAMVTDRWSFDEIWTDIKALDLCATMAPSDPIGIEFKALFTEHKKYHMETVAKIKSYVERADEFQYIKRLVDTKTGGANPVVLTHPPVKDSVHNFLRLYSGTHIIGTEEEVAKAIPAKVDSFLTSYLKMSEEEKKILVNEMNGSLCE